MDKYNQYKSLILMMKPIKQMIKIKWLNLKLKEKN